MPSDTPHSINTSIEELLQRFSSGSLRQRKGLIKTIEDRAEELAGLGPKVLSSFDSGGDEWPAGWILQVLQRHSPEALLNILPSGTLGWFTAPSLVDIDYEPLQKALLCEGFEEADRFTNETLRKLAGPGAESRGYVYFSEVEAMPGLDLVTLDRLWKAYSQGRFGFSIQARLLEGLNGRYDKLWPRIGWKKDGEWTRYPKAFDWSLMAPEGHMPLINQLRGVRLMDALLHHPDLASRC